MKILVLCDSPTANTDTARVAEQLFKRWIARHVEVEVWGVGFELWSFNKYPYRVFAAGGAHEWCSQARLNAFLEKLTTGAYTCVCIMLDNSSLFSGQFSANFKRICRQKNIRSMLFLPQEALPQLCQTGFVAGMDVAVTYRAFALNNLGEKMIVRGSEVDWFVVPQGIDLDSFKPLAERVELRRSLQDRPWIAAADFLMLYVNPAPRREDVIGSFEILAGLRQRGIPAKLVILIGQKSSEDLLLATLGQELGLRYRYDWEFHDLYCKNGHSRIREVEMAKVYNVADLYLITTPSGGWAARISEALACGCSVALPLHRDCLDQLNEATAGRINSRLVELPTKEQNIGASQFDNPQFGPINLELAIQAIESYYNSGHWRQRPPLDEDLLRLLSWDGIAEQLLNWMKGEVAPAKLTISKNKPVVSLKESFSSNLRSPDSNTFSTRPDFYMEFGGGLGDVFNQMYYRGAYNVLRDLKPNESVRVALICHNPHVKELFEFHPKRSQIEVLDLGYWHGDDEDRRRRARYKLPPQGANGLLPEKDGNICFFESEGDREIIHSALKRIPSERLIVFSASAGGIDRTLPGYLFVELVERIQAAGYWVALVGRNYNLPGHKEIRYLENFSGMGERFLDLIDQLTVPGVVKLLEAAAGLVTCHSCLNILAWHLHKPQLLLYPEDVYHRHIATQSQWAFGINRPETIHSTFDEYKSEMVQRFLDQLLSAAVPS